MRKLVSEFRILCTTRFLLACADDRAPTSTQPIGGSGSDAALITGGAPLSSGTGRGGTGGLGGSIVSGGTGGMGGLALTGNDSRQGTNMVIENSVFDQVNNPHYYDSGMLVAIGNIYRSTTGQTESSGSTYSFFDPGKLYQYTLDPASEVEAILTKCTGPRAELGK